MDVKSALPSHLMEGFNREVKPKNVMGKEEFLNLLMTQLKHQDPLKPMEHSEFIAQLAQFSSLEQLSNIGQGVEKLHGGLGEEAKLQALGMIGKRIDADGDVIMLEKGRPVPVTHSLSPGTKAIRATLYNDQGKLVRKLDLAGRSVNSSREIVWDGRDDEGTLLPSGKYTFRVLGLNKEGKAEEVGTEISGRVTGVTLEGKRPVLTVETAGGKKEVELGRVRRISVEAPSRETSPKGKAAIGAPQPTSKVLPGEGKADVSTQPTLARNNPMELPEGDSMERGWRRFPDNTFGGFKR